MHVGGCWGANLVRGYSVFSVTRYAAAGALAVAALTASATTASAAVIIKPIVGGPFDNADAIGTILGLTVRKANTYDFTFDLGGTFDVIMQLQASIAGGVSQPIDFSLFRGTPGSGVLLATSALTTGPALERLLAAGSYYLQIGTIAQDNELVSGSLSLASGVPEPAAWAMMIAGFGLVGVAARQRRSRPLVA